MHAIAATYHGPFLPNRARTTGSGCLHDELKKLMDRGHFEIVRTVGSRTETGLQTVGIQTETEVRTVGSQTVAPETHAGEI